ncbi:MAG TPA: glycosyltransferase family 9 protein [Verrucomicrobiae bacterium]|nr:glycosyltransferase family 9 protein [Verrucomicrobiae bacterium]
MKVLILKPSSLGDVVQALPVLRLLKLHRPEAQVFWWLDDGLTPLLEGDPDLAGIIPFDRRRWISPRYWGEAGRSLRDIRGRKFDWVIDLQSLARSAIVAWLANGGFTIGLQDGREGAPAFYDVAVPRPTPMTHAVDWYLEVLPPLRIPIHRRFAWLPERPEVAAALREKWDVGSARWVAVLPGARWENKRWPIGHFVEAVRLCAANHPDARFAILGSGSERELGEALARAAPGRCLNLTGGASLLEMIEWLRLCEVAVSNDTGPMHAAAAMGKPVVALFGPTEPRRTGPYGQIDRALQFHVPCAPCMKSYCRVDDKLVCLHRITPQAVAERVGQVLGNGKGARAAVCI